MRNCAVMLSLFAIYETHIHIRQQNKAEEILKVRAKLNGLYVHHTGSYDT